MSPKPPYIPLSSSSIRGCPLTERSERIPYPEVPQDQREQVRERKRSRGGARARARKREGERER